MFRVGWHYSLNDFYRYTYTYSIVGRCIYIYILMIYGQPAPPDIFTYCMVSQQIYILMNHGWPALLSKQLIYIYILYDQLAVSEISTADTLYMWLTGMNV